MLNFSRVRWAKALREFRLAGVLRASYTYSFHASGCASVAQWQSTGFVNLRLWVRLPPLASQAGKAVDLRPTGQLHAWDGLTSRSARTPRRRFTFGSATVREVKPTTTWTG